MDTTQTTANTALREAHEGGLEFEDAAGAFLYRKNRVASLRDVDK
jgi:hypothetical protein